MENFTGKLLDGRYEMQEIIGVGGMAVVYRAYDNIDDRIVAVKILKEEFLANADFRRRFKNESKAIAVLSHPNIVKVYDVSYGDKLQYIVMEYVDGITLKEYIEQRRVIPPADTVYFTTQILLALQHAHDKGIVHRDIKPQNIMLLENGSIKVTDFGIARFSRSESRTLSEKAIGSVHYISPEQARGEITDERSDVYSVGVMMYEMLTGQLPFQAESPVSVAIMQLQTNAAPPSQLNPAIPMGLEQITMKAMRKNIGERYQSASEALRDLEAYTQNPNVRFNYTYYVDNEPTKYFEAVKPLTPPETRNQPYPTAPSPLMPPLDGEMAEEDLPEDKNKTVRILTWTAGIIAVLLFILGILWVTGAFSGGQKAIAPDFLGMDYATEIEKNNDYAEFTLQVKGYEYSDEFEAGQVMEQIPEGGTKIRIKTPIRLTISKGPENPVSDVVVPDIYNQELAQAKRTLTTEGILFDVLEEESDRIDEGRVIRTEPKIGDPLPLNTRLKVYVSIAAEGKTLLMPSLLNMTKNDAAKQLEKYKLKLGGVSEIESTLPKGYVVQQSVEAGKEVAEGTSIDLVLSNGKQPTKNVTLHFNLPRVNGQNGDLKVYMESVEVKELAKSVLLSGGSQSITLTGSDQDVSVVVTINGRQIYEANIDFVAGTILYEASNDYLISVPNVVGKTESDARSTLSAAGFTVSVQVDPASNNTKVIKQSHIEAVPGSTITITIGKEQITEASPVTP